MEISKEKSIDIGAVSGGDILAAENAVIPASYSVSNTGTGHGIMAEEAQTVLDKLKGHAAEVVGRDNAKNGADRLVDGVYIQTKFYKTGEGCISACFDSESGLYKYLDSNGNPMPVEVPKDLYDDALNEFRLRISKGEVPGITDTARAAEYVRSSDLTYQNAVNLCTPLTRESILYDCYTGISRCLLAFIISGIAAYLAAYKKIGNRKKALKVSIITGVKVFGLSYIAHIMCSQFARTAFFKALPNIGASETSALNIDICMKTASGGGFTSVRGGLSRFPKRLKAGVFVSLITLIVFIAPEIIRLIQRKILFKEFMYNVGIIISSRILSLVFFIGAAAMIAGYTSLSGVLNTIICLTASTIGGIIGRGIVLLINNKQRRTA